jgi:tight adherence protein B
MLKTWKRTQGFLDAPAGKRWRNISIFALLFLIFFLWFGHIILVSIISACISIYIADVFYSRKEIQKNILHRQLISFLEHMIIMLRSGKTIRLIMYESWSRFPRPLGGYLREVSQRLEIDPDFENALDLFEKRSGSIEVGLITAGIKINSRMGGDLIILLESLSITLRESLRARSRKDNLTVQSRLSANVISFFPIAALLFMYIFYSSSILDFFSTTAGTVVLVAGGLMEIMGILFMKRIIRG